VLTASYSTVVEHMKFPVALKSIIAGMVSLFIVTSHISCVYNDFVAYSSIKGVKAIPSVFCHPIHFLVT
jgi:hypothetical protein